MQTREMILLITGAACSLFVGMLYGYSHLKGPIGEMPNVDFDINSPGDIGFVGQYAAFIPGFICDAFGPATTILYGAILASSGFIICGAGVNNRSGGLLCLGMLLAGQGSKGLGFGTMLGTVNSFPDTAAGGIAGLFLALDSLSSVVAILAYDNIFDDNDGNRGYPKGIFGDCITDFFFYLGCLILCLGLISAFIFWKFYCPPGSEDFGTEEDSSVDRIESGDSGESRSIDSASVNSNGSAQIVPARRMTKGGRHSIWSEVSRKGSIMAESTLMTTFTQEGAARDAAEESHSETWWTGVVCMFLICIFSESHGLAFNGQATTAYKNAWHYENGRVMLGTEGVWDQGVQDLNEKVLRSTGDESEEKELKSSIATIAEEEHEIHDASQLEGLITSKFTYASNLLSKTLKKEYEKAAASHNLAEVSHWTLQRDEGLSGKAKKGTVVINIMHGEEKVVSVELDENDKIAYEKRKLTSGGSFDHLKSAKHVVFGQDYALDEFEPAHEGLIEHVAANVGCAKLIREQDDITCVDENGRKMEGRFRVTDADRDEKKAVMLQIVRALDITSESPRKMHPEHTPVSKLFFDAKTGAFLEGLSSAAYLRKNQAGTGFSVLDTNFNIVMPEAKASGPEEVIYYDEKRAARGMPSTSLLVMTFAVFNGVGRFLFGFISDKTHGKITWLCKAAYILIVQAMYIFAFAVMFFFGFNHTSRFFVLAMIAVVGTAYGGLFTILTAVMKVIVAKEKVGVVLGCGLVCIAIGSYAFGNILAKMTAKSEVVGDHALGPDTRKWFFLVALVCQIPVLFLSHFMWRKQCEDVRQKKAEEEAQRLEEEAAMEKFGAGPRMTDHQRRSASQKCSVSGNNMEMSLLQGPQGNDVQKC